MTYAPAAQLPLDFSIQNELNFDTFHASGPVEGLVDALRGIVEGREQFYYLWGERGVGKSHLLQAVCHANPASAYLPLKRFAAHSPAVLDGLEELDVVCVDDAGRVMGVSAWEERLFEFFNALRERGGKLLVAANSPPRGLDSGLPDLASRLAWGVVYQLPRLDDEGKAAALRARAHGRGFDLGDDLLRYILLRSEREMDSLFAVLDRLDHLSLSEKRKITIPFIRNIMGW